MCRKFPRPSCAYLASCLTTLPQSEAAVFKAHLEKLSDLLIKFNIDAIVPHRDMDPEKNASASPKQVYEVDIAKVMNSQLVIADVTYASIGLGMEIQSAGSNSIPIMLLLKKGTRISRMPLGHPNLVSCIEYENCEDCQNKLDWFLRQAF